MIKGGADQREHFLQSEGEIGFWVISTALIFLNFGKRKSVKLAQWRGTIVRTDKNVAITTPRSKVRFTKGTISPVPRSSSKLRAAESAVPEATVAESQCGRGGGGGSKCGTAGLPALTIAWGFAGVACGPPSPEQHVGPGHCMLQKGRRRSGRARNPPPTHDPERCCAVPGIGMCPAVSGGSARVVH